MIVKIFKCPYNTSNSWEDWFSQYITCIKARNHEVSDSEIKTLKCCVNEWHQQKK